MKRITAKLTQGFARLAFWRKPAAPTPEQTESPADAQRDLKGFEAPPSASAEQTEPKVSRFARLKNILRRRRAPTPVAPDEPSAGMERATRGNPEADAGEIPLVKPSLLARLKATLRRKPLADAPDADEPMPDAGRSRDPSSTRDADDDAGDETLVQPGRIRRMLAVLSKKWVWMPAAGIMLLATAGATLMLFQQSVQEKEKLQAELLATQKKLEQASGVKKAATKTTGADPVAPGPVDAPALADAGGGASGLQRGLDDGGCVVTDKASVSQNLKSCIEEFNRSMAATHRVKTDP